MPYLRFFDDTGRLRTKVLEAARFVIGRADSCQLAFDSEMISREHASIELERDGRYRIRDLGSRNKTCVNGELVRETRLIGGAVIRVGDRVLEFVDDTVRPEKVEPTFVTPDRKEPPDCAWIKTATPLSLTGAQLERLSQLVGDPPLTARAEDIAEAALGRLLLDLQADRGLIALRGESKTSVQVLTSRGLKAPADRSLMPVSQSFLLAPLLQGVAGRYPQTASRLDTKLGYAAAGLVAPLTFRGDVIGVLYVDRPRANKPFPSAALQFSAAAGAQVGALLGASSYRLAEFAGREGATWMATIRRLQGFLQTEVASSESFDAASRCFKGRLRCGDFAAVVPLDEQRCGILMIDGGGHGITGIAQAAAIMRAVQAVLLTGEEALMDPSGMFRTINRLTAASPARQVLPCTFVGVDMSSGQLSYINAGSMPPLVMVAPGRLVTLDQVSLVLGVDPDCAYEASRVDLPEAWRLVCYTAGLTEATSAAGEPFGDQRLHDVLLDRESFAGAAEVLSRISHAWTAHMTGAQPEDDALLLVVARG